MAAEAAPEPTPEEVAADQALARTDELLDDALSARSDAARADARMLTTLARWALARTRDADLPGEPLPGQERLVRPGGSGTPLVAEFLPVEAAARLGLSARAAGTLVADALTLVHRMPRLLEVLAAGYAQTWRVRMAAAAGRGVSRAACLRLEEYLVTACRQGAAAPPIVTLTRSKLTRLLEQYATTHDDEDGLHEDRGDAGDRATTEALAGRYVHIQHGVDGTSDLSARLSTADALRLDAVIDQIAADLAADGDDRPRAVRHADALGSLARRGPTGSTTKPATLFVHLDAATGTVCVDGVGTTAQAAASELLADATTVTLAPVIDLASDLTYTGYVAPRPTPHPARADPTRHLRVSLVRPTRLAPPESPSRPRPPHPPRRRRTHLHHQRPAPLSVPPSRQDPLTMESQTRRSRPHPLDQPRRFDLSRRSRPHHTAPHLRARVTRSTSRV